MTEQSTTQQQMDAAVSGVLDEAIREIDDRLVEATLSAVAKHLRIDQNLSDLVMSMATDKQREMAEQEYDDDPDSSVAHIVLHNMVWDRIAEATSKGVDLG